MAKKETDTTTPDGTGYSKTYFGEIGADGVHRDWNGNVVPNGIDEDTKAELQRLIDGPRVRIVPSENDIIAGNTGPGAHQGQVYVDPNASADEAAQAFRPGYAVESASDDGKTAEQKEDEASQETASKTSEDSAQ
jgi:hypothetical protein